MSEIKTITEILKPRRKVHTLFIHCTASSNPNYGVEEITRDHIKRDFGTIGYHWVIYFDGRLMRGRDPESMPVAQRGHNLDTLAVCLQGLHITDFTIEQMGTLNVLVRHLNAMYPPKGLRIRGHREVSNKTCPVFDYRKVLNLDAEGYVKTGVDRTPKIVHTAPVDWRAEVIEFQRQQGLKGDGVIGPATWAKIKPFLP
jgi:hypothetical protein